MTPLYRRGPARLAAGTAAAVAALALTAGAGCGGRSPERPDVLLVVIASLRADHVSAYGYRRVTTPSIDAVAASGTLFENAVTTAPWGVTAQASLLTGLQPSEHAAVFGHPVLEPPLVTLAESLKESGYATFGVSTDPGIGREAGFTQGFDSFVEVDRELESAPDEGAAVAEKALLDWLGSRRDAPEPSFAYVLLSNPQLPFSPPGEFRQKFLERPMPLPRLDQLSQYWLPFARQFTLELVTLDPDEKAALISLYDGEVAYADYRVGRILEAVRANGRLDQTLVVVTSDVGEDLGDHGLLAASSHLYDSLVRVPLVMRLPSRIPGGLRVAEQVQTLDVGRAILALAAPAPPAAPPAAPSSAGFPMPERPYAILEARLDPSEIQGYRALLPDADFSSLERNLLAVRTRDHKFIYSSRGAATLYDLQADPGETLPVIRDQPEVAREMASRLDEWAAAMGTPLGISTPPGLAGPGGPEGAAAAQAPAR